MQARLRVPMGRPGRRPAASRSARSRMCALALALACAPALGRPAATPPDPSCERSTLSAGPLRIDAWSCTLPTGRWHVRAEPGLRGFVVDPGHPRWVVYVNEGQDGTLIDPATLRIRD
jgi:hypothetical protein